MHLCVPHYYCHCAAGFADCALWKNAFTHFCAVSYWYAASSTTQYKKSASFILLFSNLQSSQLTCMLLVLRCSRGRLGSHRFHKTKLFSPSHLKTTPCDKLMLKIVMFIFNRWFYEIYLFFLIFPPILISRIVPFSPSAPATLLITIKSQPKFWNVSRNIFHCSVSNRIY